MISIINVADRPELIETVARWRWQEWGRDKSLDYVRYSARHNALRDRIPMTFIAMKGDEPVGCVSIWMNDLTSRQDLYPWLASLYVDEEHRNQGIGTLLQRHVIAQVKQLGYRSLYLITDHIGYYERLGWTYLESAPKVNNQLVRVYEMHLDR